MNNLSSINPLLLTDSYKLGHADQYPEGTEFIYSNFTPRSKKYAYENFLKYLSPKDQKIVVFGLQAVLIEMKQIWDDGFFKHPKEEVVNEFLTFIQPYMPKAYLDKMKKRVEELHDYGKLPIKVNALPEGSLVDEKIPVFTVVNTKKQFYWITNYLETWLSANLWKPMVSASIARTYRHIIQEFANKTGISQSPEWKDFINWQGHDFSMRGMSGIYDSRSTGVGHLTSFYGSDTLIAAKYAQEMYGFGLPKDYLYAASVPATEHSVMCVGSSVGVSNDGNGEFNLFKRLITETYPDGIVSIVSDTWDYWKVVTDYTVKLKDTILKRNGKLVIRPDSGNPVRILAGYRVFKTYTVDQNSQDFDLDDYFGKWKLSIMYNSNKEFDERFIIEVKCKDQVSKYYEIFDLNYEEVEEHEVLGSVQVLWNIFGGTETVGVDNKTYKTLDGHIGLIYGDSITPAVCYEILSRLEEKGFSSANVVFGIGSYTYNYHTRDTFGLAMKATYGVVNGVGCNVMKSPKTDKNKLKKSAIGLLKVTKEADGKHDKFILEDGLDIPVEELLTYDQGELKTVFNDGEFIQDNLTNLKEIREKLIV
jgi:hypothetical protein